ncbi:MAG: PSD1 and planctomycete cytochrome C domain-containing protein [Opitutales bacterium]
MRFPTLACSLVVASGLLAADGSPEPVRFNRDIRPMMSDTCFHCHGFDPKSRKGGLRLDIREEALKAGKSGEIAIVPGKPEQSEIIKRIFSTDAEDVMPEKEAHKTLTPAQKELFRRWVAEGAVYEPHWAYKALELPAIPQMPAGGKNPIDAFIGAKLAEKKIKPSPEATKERLLRRVSLDLTGLPPTPAEVAAFLADQSPDAYDKQVDRLLASPRFGERMAVWWLDIARFADTVGYHGDQNQRIFPYRDYVIKAFNDNKPFDAFTREQLAGDLLPNPTEEQLVASGYNRLNMMTREGGAQAKEYLSKYGAERVRSVSNAWLGSTFGCAECHDHKFDPIKSADFYTLQAFFADVKQWGVYADYSYTPEPELKGVGNDHPFYPEIRTKSAYLSKKDAQYRAELSAFYDQALKELRDDKDFAAWRQSTASFLTAHPTGLLTPAGSFLHKPAPAAPAKMAPKAETKAAAKNAAKKPAAPTPTAFAADSVIKMKKGVAKGEDLAVTLEGITTPIASVRVDIPKGALPVGSSSNISARFGVVDAKGKERGVAFHLADASHREPRYNSSAEQTDINGGWTLKMPDADVHAVWLLDAALTLKADEKFVIHFDSNAALSLKLSVSPLSHDAPLKATSASTLAAAKETAPTAAGLAVYLNSRGSDRTRLATVREISGSIRRQYDGYAWSMVTQAAKPLTVRILPRGNFLDESGPVVLPATPSFLPGLRTSTEEKRLTRLDLAEWIVSKDNPITARTVMNRLWQVFHGTGLSAVLDDLGSQGELPSHPELLEWLSLEFRDKGWDMKKMVRLMVTSRTYRQSSSLRPELKDIDPNNRLLASQNPRRLDAEFVRDNALFIAGLLNTEDVGGPSVKPYQPDGYYEPIQFPNRTYVASKGSDQWRRGLYMHWQRMFLHPMLINFDAPARDECTALRNYSNTPQQALTLLNDPTFVEAARVMASRLQAAPSAERLALGFRLAMGRDPKPAERPSLEKLVGEQTAYYRANPAEATKLLKVGLSPAPAGDPAELAAWTQACRVLLNSHEAITRY